MVLIWAVVSDIWVRKKPAFLSLKCNIYLGKQRSWLILVPNHQFMQLHFGCALVVGVGIISLVCGFGYPSGFRYSSFFETTCVRLWCPLTDWLTDTERLRVSLFDPTQVHRPQQTLNQLGQSHLQPGNCRWSYHFALMMSQFSHLIPVSSPSPLPKRNPGELMLRTLREHWLAILVFATESEASISVQHVVFILPCCANVWPFRGSSNQLCWANLGHVGLILGHVDLKLRLGHAGSILPWEYNLVLLHNQSASQPSIVPVVGFSPGHQFEWSARGHIGGSLQVALSLGQHMCGLLWQQGFGPSCSKSGWCSVVLAVQHPAF